MLGRDRESVEETVLVSSDVLEPLGVLEGNVSVMTGVGNELDRLRLCVLESASVSVAVGVPFEGLRLDPLYDFEKVYDGLALFTDSVASCEKLCDCVRRVLDTSKLLDMLTDADWLMVCVDDCDRVVERETERISEDDADADGNCLESDGVVDCVDDPFVLVRV